MSGQGMSLPPDLTERRKQNRRDTQLWDRDVNGYAICPWCAALIYSDRADFHQEKCGAAQIERRGGKQELIDELRKAAAEELEG